jgi:hypothetical protein
VDESVGLAGSGFPRTCAGTHFPSRLYQFIWRNWELASADRMAKVLGATPDATVKKIGSPGRTPETMLANRRWVPAASAKPRIRPTTTNCSASRNTSPSTSLRPAPRAIRTPISRRRLASHPTRPASNRAVREMKEDGELPRLVKVRSSQYLNNLVEQEHRRVKQRTRPMLGFKRFDNAAVTISGIELAEKIKKGQYKTGKLGSRRVGGSRQGFGLK